MGKRTDTRQRMIGAAKSSFRTRGVQNTSFTDVIAAAGAARGAIYHHFPGGKRELVVEVVADTGRNVQSAIATSATSLEQVLSMIDLLVDVVDADPNFGCPIAPAVLESPDDDDVLAAAATAYSSWESALADMLADGSRATAQSDATLIVAAVEGALLLSRAERSGDPIRRVRTALTALISPDTSRSDR